MRRWPEGRAEGAATCSCLAEVTLLVTQPGFTLRTQHETGAYVCAVSQFSNEPSAKELAGFGQRLNGRYRDGHGGRARAPGDRRGHRYRACTV
jgi:hypothetical protein